MDRKEHPMNQAMNQAMNTEQTGAATADNAIPIEAWNTILFEKFTRFKWVMTTGLSAHSEEFLRQRAYPAGARVLDVGCGWGDTALQIARQVGPSGSVLGVDCAANFVNAAAEDAKGAGLPNLSFAAADVQSDNLKGPYDFAFSRFGTMFFNMPVPALRNIKNALRPGGGLAMIVWRKREDNAWIHKAEMLVRELVPVVSHDDTDQVHCGPGPFSMAGADMVSDMLRIAGFERANFQRYDTDICVGRTIDDAVEFAMTIGPAGEIIRLAGGEGQKRKDKVIAALRQTFAGHARPDGVWLSSSSWFVTATRPAH
jgi:ubiquinone/menaquinone biosynthesis C-methylase UbiE